MISSNKPIPTGFWQQIDHQLKRIGEQAPNTFAGVQQVLHDPDYSDILAEVHRNGLRHFDIDSAFFAGSGGEASLAAALRQAGWQTVAVRAEYYYTMTHPRTNEFLTYIEGDLVRGQHLV